MSNEDLNIEDLRSLNKEIHDLEQKLKELKNKEFTLNKHVDKYQNFKEYLNNAPNTDDNLDIVSKPELKLNPNLSNVLTILDNGILLNDKSNIDDLIEMYHESLKEANLYLYLNTQTSSLNSLKIRAFTNIVKSDYSDYLLTSHLNFFLQLGLDIKQIKVKDNYFSKTINFEFDIFNDDFFKYNILQSHLSLVEQINTFPSLKVLKINDIYRKGYISLSLAKQIYCINDDLTEIISSLNPVELKEYNSKNIIPFNLIDTKYDSKDLVILPKEWLDYYKKNKLNLSEVVDLGCIKVIPLNKIKHDLPDKLYKKASKMLIEVANYLNDSISLSNDIISIKRYISLNIGISEDKIVNIDNNFDSNFKDIVTKYFIKQFNKKQKEIPKYVLNKFIQETLPYYLGEDRIDIISFKTILKYSTLTNSGLKYSESNNIRKYKKNKKKNKPKQKNKKKENFKSGFYVMLSYFTKNYDIDIFDLYNLIKQNNVKYHSFGPDFIMFDSEQIKTIDDLIKKQKHNDKNLTKNNEIINFDNPKTKISKDKGKNTKNYYLDFENDYYKNLYQKLSGDLKKSYVGIKRVIEKQLRQNIVTDEQFIKLVQDYDLLKISVNLVLIDENNLNKITNDLNNYNISDFKELYSPSKRFIFNCNHLKKNNSYKLLNGTDKSKYYLEQLLKSGFLEVDGNEHWSKTNNNSQRGASIIKYIKNELNLLYKNLGLTKKPQFKTSHDHLKLTMPDKEDLRTIKYIYDCFYNNR